MSLRTQTTDGIVTQKALFDRQTDDGTSVEFLHHGRTGILIVGYLGNATLTMETKAPLAATEVWIPVNQGEIHQRHMIQTEHTLAGSPAYGLAQPLADSIPGTYRLRLKDADIQTVLWVWGVSM